LKVTRTYRLKDRMALPDKQAIDTDEDAVPSSEGEKEMQEGIDYYLEDGLFVFTAAFLRKRGYCCESGCRHCPYQTCKPDQAGPSRKLG